MYFLEHTIIREVFASLKSRISLNLLPNAIFVYDAISLFCSFMIQIIFLLPLFPKMGNSLIPHIYQTTIYTFNNIKCHHPTSIYRCMSSWSFFITSIIQIIPYPMIHLTHLGHKVIEFLFSISFCHRIVQVTKSILAISKFRANILLKMPNTCKMRDIRIHNSYNFNDSFFAIWYNTHVVTFSKHTSKLLKKPCSWAIILCIYSPICYWQNKI